MAEERLASILNEARENWCAISLPNLPVRDWIAIAHSLIQSNDFVMPVAPPHLSCEVRHLLMMPEPHDDARRANVRKLLVMNSAQDGR